MPFLVFPSLLLGLHLFKMLRYHNMRKLCRARSVPKAKRVPEADVIVLISVEFIRTPSLFFVHYEAIHNWETSLAPFCGQMPTLRETCSYCFQHLPEAVNKSPHKRMPGTWSPDKERSYSKQQRHKLLSFWLLRPKSVGFVPNKNRHYPIPADF